MALTRHKHVLRKVSGRNPLVRIGLPTAVTFAVVSGGIAVSVPAQTPAQSSTAISMPRVETSPVPVRVAPISRSAERVELKPKPPEVVGYLFATTAVNVRATPSESGKKVEDLEWAEKVAVSGARRGQWVQVVFGKSGYWVHSDYLAKKKPRPEPEPEVAEEESSGLPSTGLSMAPCASGSDVESGLVPNAVAVHRAVCGAFPSITSYGGVREGDSGEHGSGQALDIMISGDAGWDVAEYVRANADALGVSEVLYSQRIWTVERSSEGWRSMEDRGSDTANHYDHVHVSVY